MFVPSESVYYEMLMTDDGKGGRLDDYCRGRRVLAVSPNTCFAYLGAIAMSLRGMKVEENARKLMASFAGLEKQMEVFVDVFEKLGTHLHNAGQSYEAAEIKTDASARHTRANVGRKSSRGIATRHGKTARIKILG